MALQSIWWRDISKNPLFELLQAKFQPERTHSSRLVVIWSRLSQSLQNTHWRQWLPHLTRISSHRAKFLSLGTERSHTGPNPENRVDEESIHSPIYSFVIATVDLWRRVVLMEDFFAPISLQMTIKHSTCVLSGWNLAWRGSKVRRMDLSRCHQMDCSAISWKFTKLIKRPTYIYIYIYCFIQISGKKFLRIF